MADVDSPDNAWSRTTRERRIDCGECAKQWVLRSERELVDRGASEGSSAAWNRIYAINQALEPLARDAIDEIFKATPCPTFKAEHQLLTTARLCSKGPAVYSRERKAGASISSLCDCPLANVSWITARLANPALRGQIVALASEKAKSELDRQQLAKQMDATAIAINSLPR